MTPQLFVIKVRLEINKLHSSDQDYIPDWQIVMAANKAQNQWLRRQIHGGNIYQEGDESSKMRVDDLQPLLTTATLKGRNHDLYFESAALPANYYWSKRVVPKVTSGECKNIPLVSMHVEEANTSVYLNDWAFSPSFQWRHCFHTFAGNRVKVYTNNNFSVDKIDLVYYRKPAQFDIAGYIHESEIQSSNVPMEFKDDVVEVILNETVAILAGEIESPNPQAIAKQETEQDN